MKLIRGEFLLSPQKDIPLNWNCGSLFHGAFMQRLDPSYGEALHRSGPKPFSQYLTCAPEECKWVFQTLTEDAEQQIWEQPSIQEWNEIYLEQKNATFKIKERSITVLSEEDLMQRTFFGNCARRVSISFVTPTAFKTNGGYQNYPTTRHIFQSLISKFDTASAKSQIASPELLENLEQYVKITNYSLRSTTFSLEGVRIPSFIGWLKLTLLGPQQFVNLCHMLLRFGTFSGVGIKTALGMGAIQFNTITKGSAHGRADV